MSQTTIPFQSVDAVEAAPAPELEASQSTRVLVAIGAVGALAVLAVAVYFLLFAGGGDDSLPDAVAPAPKSAVVPEPAPATVPKAATVKVTAKNFGTDPFKPLLVEAVVVPGGTAAVDPGTTTPATTENTTSTGTTTGSPGTTPPASSTSHRFDVVDVSADNTTIDVKLDGVMYESLGAGEVFAEVFKVRYIGGSANSFQIGDEVFTVTGRKAVAISG